MADIETTKSQYEAFPYPPRKPADEKKRLITGSPSEWCEVNHNLFQGMRDPAEPISVLVAGGGTGDGLILLAQRLADLGTPADVHYLDLSTASRAIAEKRAEARGLKSITFHTGSLLDLPTLGLGPFDYIDCCGVLHHLPDPLSGVKALKAVLKKDGGMGLMVYAPHGRTGVYAMQAALRGLIGDEQPAVQVRLAKKLLKDLPATNWLKRNPHVGDHVNAGDAGLYDLLLHATDQPFDVPALLQLLAAGGLRLVSWAEPLRYDARTYLLDPQLKKQAEALPEADNWALAERLSGNISTHVFYATTAERQENTVAVVAPTARPVLRDIDGPGLAKVLKPGQPLKVTIGGLALSLSLPRLSSALFERIDGKKTIDQLFSELHGLQPQLTREAFDAQFADFFRTVNGLGKLYLQCRSAPN